MFGSRVRWCVSTPSLHSALEQNLSTSDFGAAIKKQLSLTGGPFQVPLVCTNILIILHMNIGDGGSSGTGGRLPRLILLLRFALLSKLVGGAGIYLLCVCRFPPYTAAAASQSLLAAIKSKTELSLHLRAWLMG
jgi:hypothetical protein